MEANSSRTYQRIYWNIVSPDELESARVLAKRRVLQSLPLFLLTLMRNPPQAGGLLPTGGTAPAGAVATGTAGERWIEGDLAYPKRLGASRPDVLIDALRLAALEDLISVDEATRLRRRSCGAWTR
jgi:hypothetical protein